MNVNEVKELLALFDASTVREMDLSIDNVALKLSKNTQSAAASAPAPSGPETVSQPVANPQPVVPPAETQAASEPTPPVAAGKLVESPIVGVVYLSSGPDKPVFKQVGDRVEVGDVLCIVEAMKLMNEITSDVAGEITEILIDNEDVVEYGQPLFRIA